MIELAIRRSFWRWPGTSSFAVFERPVETEAFSISDDILSAGGKSYDFAGHDLMTPSQHLKRVTAYQEFWHSWRTFHPDTVTY